MTPPTPRGRSPIRRRALRTALVAALTCGLCATTLPTSASANDENALLPNGELGSSSIDATSSPGAPCSESSSSCHSRGVAVM